jgi:microcystin-dependent protein
MPRQSSGAYQQPAGTSAVSLATIGSTAFNSLVTDLGNELTNSLDRLGRSAMQAAFPMGGFTITGLANGVNPTDACSVSQAQGFANTAAALLAPGFVMAAAIPIASSVTGWLGCNGTPVSRSTYAALFAVIGTTYGVGDGSTTFNLPDFRGEFIRGSDNGRGVDPSRTLGSWQDQAFLSHNHSATSNVTDPGHNHPNFSGITGAGGGGPVGVFGVSPGNNTAGATTNISVATTIVAAGGVETRPRNFALNFFIKT